MGARFAGVLIALLSLFANACLGASLYSVKEITSDVHGNRLRGVRDINNSEQVVGIDDNGHAVLWQNDTMYDLGILPGCSLSRGPNWWAPSIYIDDSAQVAGTAAANDGTYHGFFRDPVQGMRDIGSLGVPNTLVNGINNSGHVAGSSWSPEGLKGFSYDGQSMTAIDGLPVTDNGYSVGTGINDRGAVVGYSMPAGLVYWWCHGFLWRDGRLSDLGLPTPSTSNVWPSGINDADEIIGIYRDDRGGNYGFLDSGGQFTDLGQVWPTDINDAAQVVGFLGSAWLWENGQMYDLNTRIVGDLDCTLTEAMSINDRGQILASYEPSQRYFILTPVPEPSTLVLLGLGVIGAAHYLRRRPA